MSMDSRKRHRRRQSVGAVQQGGRPQQQQQGENAAANIDVRYTDVNNGPPKEWYRRWRHHLIFVAFYDVSNIIQSGISAVDDVGSFSAKLMQWFMLVFGSVSGGFGVHLVRYIIDKLVSYLPMPLVYIILAIIVLGGPDLSPPLTLANGPETLFDRLKWTALFTFIHYSHYLPDMLKGYELPLSSYNTMTLISGIWHFDRGDYSFRKFSWELATNDRMREYFMMTEENISTMLMWMMLFHFQASAGVGMIWAACGVYSFTTFFIALALFVVVNCFIYFCLGGRELDDSR